MKKISKARRGGPGDQELSRIQTGRMWQIHQALAEGGPVNCSQMGRKLEVDRRTIHRDLDFMRDRLNLPIDYDARRKTYLYTKPVKQFPTLTISPGEMLALTTAQHTLAQYGGAPFARNLETALAASRGTPARRYPILRFVDLRSGWRLDL